VVSWGAGAFITQAESDPIGSEHPSGGHASASAILVLSKLPGGLSEVAASGSGEFLFFDYAQGEKNENLTLCNKTTP